MDVMTKFSIPGITFLVTLVFGFWLSHSGKPYNIPLFNVHKLIALGAVIITAVQLSKILKTADSPALVTILLVAAGLCVVALFATGALMSLGKLEYALTLTIHRIAPALLTIAMVLVVYLIVGRS